MNTDETWDCRFEISDLKPRKTRNTRKKGPADHLALASHRNPRFCSRSVVSCRPGYANGGFAVASQWSFGQWFERGGCIKQSPPHSLPEKQIPPSCLRPQTEIARSVISDLKHGRRGTHGTKGPADATLRSTLRSTSHANALR